MLRGVYLCVCGSGGCVSGSVRGFGRALLVLFVMRVRFFIFFPSFFLSLRKGCIHRLWDGCFSSMINDR